MLVLKIVIIINIILFPLARLANKENERKKGPIIPGTNIRIVENKTDLWSVFAAILKVILIIVFVPILIWILFMPG